VILDLTYQGKHATNRSAPSILASRNDDYSAYVGVIQIEASAHHSRDGAARKTEPLLDKARDHLDPVVRTVAMPSDTNPAGDIFGGWLMWQMDFAAGSVAARRAGGRCVTVAVEAISFISPVYVGDEVSIYGKLVSTGRSSMRIQVEAWRRSREGNDYLKVTEATFTFVATDEHRKPRALPMA
jgi:acyl-CoA thioesterase YciA